MTTVEELYGEIWADDEAIARALERSLEPRSTESLFDAFAALEPSPADLVVDVGCRDARHTIELVRRFDVRVLAVDPVERHVGSARAAVAAAGLADRVDVVRAAIESLPLADGAADLIWCRDVLNHVDLERGLGECARVLRPGGRMLVYQTFATELLGPREAERLYAATAIVADNMNPAFFEGAAQNAQLRVVSVDTIGSEWRERMAEDGRWDPARDLLAIARLARSEHELSERYGRKRVEAARADALWGIYQLLGKLRPTVYALERRADG